MQERLKATDGGFLIALVEAGSEMFPVWLDLSPFIKDDWNTCIHNFCVFVHCSQIISLKKTVDNIKTNPGPKKLSL